MMIVRLLLACGVVVTITSVTTSVWADETLAAYLAGTCSTCHHPSDKGAAMPTLAGRDAAELIAALQAYRTGARQDAAMHAVATSLTDAETADVAAYFSHQEPAQ